MTDRETRKIDVLQICDTDGPIMKREVADMLGCTVGTASEYINELEEEGFLQEGTEFRIDDPDTHENIVTVYKTTKAGRERVYEFLGERRVAAPPWKPQI